MLLSSSWRTAPLALALTGLLASPTVHARTPSAASSAGTLSLVKKRRRKKKVDPNARTPEQAEAERKTVLDNVQAQLEVGDYALAAEALQTQGTRLGDPVLFMEASRVLLQEAEAESSKEVAEAAKAPAYIALDILHFLVDKPLPTKTRWNVLSLEAAETAIPEAQALLQRSDEIQASLDRDAHKAKVAAASVSRRVDAEDERIGKLDPGSGYLIPGYIFTALGIAGAGVAGAGIALGLQKQDEVEGLDLPAENDKYPDLDSEGQAANMMVYVGAGAGIACLVTGLTLIGIGTKKRNAANGRRANLRVSPTYGGMTISGRF